MAEQPREPQAAGPPRRDVVARVERRVDALSSRMAKRFVVDIPAYGHLPREQVEGEIREICAFNLRLFISSVRQGRPPHPTELEVPRASAARRAEEGVPLGQVLAAYHLGARMGWDAFVEEMEPDDTPSLTEIAERMLDYVQAVTEVAADAYVEEHRTIDRERRDARRRLAELLVTGADDADELVPSAGMLARQAGIELAPGYLVAQLAIQASRDERAAGVETSVAGRRKIRRLLGRADEVAGDGVLELLDPEGGTLLLPVSGNAASWLRGSEQLVTSLGEAADAGLTVALSWHSGLDGVATAAAEAAAVLDIVVRLGRGPGVYRLGDVALEYAMSRPREATALVASLLEPGADHPWLLETLEAWVAHDFDRRSVAAALHIHPNSLDYRLRRIGKITGADPGSARGVQLLCAALTARRLLAE